mgnify:CR=1 FL=1
MLPPPARPIAEAPKPAEADKATKMPAFLPSRPGVLEGLAPAPNPASAGDGVVRLGRDGAGNADPASRVRNQILGGPPGGGPDAGCPGRGWFDDPGSLHSER